MIRLALSAATIAAIAVAAVPDFQALVDRAPASAGSKTAPTVPPASGGARLGDLVVAAGPDGQFRVTGSSGGQRLDMLVDTGATLVALRAGDARRLGVHVGPADYTVPVSTANGSVKAARVRLGDLSVGRLRIADVDALVLPDDLLGQNLLGMSWLGRLDRFEVAGSRLVLSD